MSFINVNKANFYYELIGQGHPLILISGYATDHTLWLASAQALSQHFQVLLFDNRGVGQTTDDGCALSTELMADDVVALAQALGLEKPHIIGISMGGTIAQQVAIRHPDKLSKLGLVATTYFWRQRTIQGLGAILKMREAGVSDELQMDAVLPWIFGQDFLSVPKNIAVFKELKKSNPHPQSLENQQRQFKMLEHFNSAKRLKDITAPTLVMYGDEDLLSLPHESEYLASEIQDASLHEFSCAHAIPAELPDEFVEVVCDFFSDCSCAGH